MTTVRQKILLALAVSVRWTRHLASKPDAITVAAWAMFPEDFGLGRWGSKYPNNNAVLAKFCGVDGILSRDWAWRDDVGSYALTAKGLRVAAELFPSHSDLAERVPPDALSSERAVGESPRSAADSARRPARPQGPTESAPPEPEGVAPRALHVRRSGSPAPRKPRPKALAATPPAEAAPLTDVERARAAELTRAYGLQDFTRGRPVNFDRARDAWGLSDAPGAWNAQRMAEVGAFVERVAASKHLRAAESGLLRSLHAMAVARNAPWLAARGAAVGR